MTLNIVRNGVCGEAVCYFLLVICSFSEIGPTTDCLAYMTCPSNGFRQLQL